MAITIVVRQEIKSNWYVCQVHAKDAVNWVCGSRRSVGRTVRASLEGGGGGSPHRHCARPARCPRRYLKR